MGLPETLGITPVEVHRGMLEWEVDVSRFPIIQGLLNRGPYRGGLWCTLIFGSRCRRNRWQYLENLRRCLSE